MALSWSEFYSVLDQAAKAQGVTLTPQQQIAMGAISNAESSRNVGAVGSGVDHSLGLFQINPVAHPQYNPTLLRTNPVYNAEAALEVSNNATNFQPWTTAQTGAAQANVQSATQGFADTFYGGPSGSPTATLANYSGGTPTANTAGFWSQAEQWSVGALEILGSAGAINPFSQPGKGAAKAAGGVVQSAVSSATFLGKVLTHIDMIVQIVFGTIVLLFGLLLLASGSLTNAVGKASPVVGSVLSKEKEAA